MFGYDWPRLHAALNDLPTALLVTAVVFQLLALATRREAFREVCVPGHGRMEAPASPFRAISR